MDTTKAAPYQQQLLQQQAALLAQLAEQRGGTLDRVQAAAEHFSHTEDSRAQVATERSLEFALEDRETEHLNTIASALHRIEAGTYGDCIDCGQEIAAPRLHATPEAARCMHCQQAAETQAPSGR
jgi:DnaK suppressor protein